MMTTFEAKQLLKIEEAIKDAQNGWSSYSPESSHQDISLKSTQYPYDFQVKTQLLRNIVSLTSQMMVINMKCLKPRKGDSKDLCDAKIKDNDAMT